MLHVLTTVDGLMKRDPICLLLYFSCLLATSLLTLVWHFQETALLAVKERKIRRRERNPENLRAGGMSGT